MATPSTHPPLSTPTSTDAAAGARRPRVLLAPDKFKGTLTAAQVAGHLRRGILASCPETEVVVTPVADGGDGTVAAAVAAGFDLVQVQAAGPTGMLGRSVWARRGQTAVVELAAVCGLDLLPGHVPDPLGATSLGVGQAVRAALDAGCTEIVLGIGGSASTDGGLGLLRALGAEVLDTARSPVGEGGGALADVAFLDLSGLHPRLRSGDAHVVVASDVDNPLTGPRGAASVYGPQKGATPADVADLDAALTHWADVVAATTGADHRDVPGAGAAGGVGFAAIAVLGARLQPGVELILGLTGFTEALAGADLVVTGEGSLDEQTLHGKAPAGVARAARAAGVPVTAVAGRCTLDSDTLRANGIDATWTLVDEATRPDESFTDPGRLLERIGARIGVGLLARSAP